MSLQRWSDCFLPSCLLLRVKRVSAEQAMAKRCQLRTHAPQQNVTVNRDQQAAEHAMRLVPSVISSSGWRTCTRLLITQ